MKEIREIFETVRKYCGMMFGDEKLDAKRQRCEDAKSVSEAAKQLGSEAAKSVTGNTKSILALPRRCEGKVTEGIQPINSRHSEGNNNLIPKNLVTSNQLDLSLVAQDGDNIKNLAAWLPSRLAAKKAAFTLAEVLITLGIIGVVAALTLPTLIQNHQKQVYVTQLKKAYSTLNNAINKMAVDEGVVDWSQTRCAQDYNVSSECFDALSKQFKIVKAKKGGEPCNADWCTFKGYEDHWMFGDAATIIVTSDGITYLFECSVFGSVFVDINGTVKGPNIDGRDRFEFFINYNNNNNKIEPSGGAESWGVQGHVAADAWKNCSATDLTTACTAKVFIEGKMNY